MSNWLAVQEATLKKTKRILVEAEYNPEYDKLPVRNIHKLILSAEAEIARLQNEVTRMVGVINDLREEIEKGKKVEN